MKELLKPRFKLIQTYPGCMYKVGDILGCLDGYDFAIGYLSDMSTNFQLSDFPYQFKKLDWWVDRDVSEMPDYVVGVTSDVKDKVFKVKEHHFPSNSCFVETDVRGVDGYWLYYGKLKPSNEEEYEDFLTNNKHP